MNNNIKNLADKTILVVEDDYVCFQLIKEVLADSKVEIIHTQTAGKAIELIRKNVKLDLIMMDIQLPDYSGIQASEIIRSLNPTIPIIIQTAYAFDSYIKKSQEIGCNDFILKPIEPSKLIEVVNKYLQGA